MTKSYKSDIVGLLTKPLAVIFKLPKIQGRFLINFTKKTFLKFSVFLLVFTFFCIIQENDVYGVDCSVVSKDLNADYSRYQAKGGLWSLLEKSEALKAKSMIGLQLDSKIRRAITIYENQCEVNPKNSNIELARKISGLLDEGRMITNNNPETVPAKIIMQSVESLLAHSNELLAEIEK